MPWEGYDDDHEQEGPSLQQTVTLSPALQRSTFSCCCVSPAAVANGTAFSQIGTAGVVITLGLGGNSCVSYARGTLNSLHLPVRGERYGVLPVSAGRLLSKRGVKYTGPGV